MPVYYNGMIYRAKSDNLTGVFARAQWERISQPPMRQFLGAGDADTILTQAYALQEIIFAEDRTINGIKFFNGDRVLIKNDLNGSFATSDFYYFPFDVAEQPQTPQDSTDSVLTGTIGQDVDFFFVIANGEEITLNTNVTDKIAWATTGAAYTGSGSITKIVYNNDLMGSSQVLEKDTDYTIKSGTNNVIVLTDIGLEPDDTLVVTFNNS